MAEPALALLVGLGNPGPQYARTRHNAGFWLADALADRYGGQFRAEPRFGGEVCRIRLAGRELWLLKPQTFMNRSGLAVVRLAGFYKLVPQAILVVHDELDLPPGVARLKRGGGHGGHNGLRDIMGQLGASDFLRLRLGIGHPGNSQAVIGYVLTAPPPDQQGLLEAAVAAALEVMPLVVEGQLERAMHDLHSRRVAAPVL
jgi:PTH1 family peptidyl-tRNA hydrolase